MKKKLAKNHYFAALWPVFCIFHQKSSGFSAIICNFAPEKTKPAVATVATLGFMILYRIIHSQTYV